MGREGRAVSGTMFGQGLFRQRIEFSSESVFLKFAVPLVSETLLHPIVQTVLVGLRKSLDGILNVFNRAHVEAM